MLMIEIYFTIIGYVLTLSEMIVNTLCS